MSKTVRLSRDNIDALQAEKPPVSTVDGDKQRPDAGLKEKMNGKESNEEEN